MKKEKLNKQLKFISFFLQIREVFPKTAILSYRSKHLWKGCFLVKMQVTELLLYLYQFFLPYFWKIFLRVLVISWTIYIGHYRTITGLFTFTYFYIGMLLENVIWNHVKQILQAAIWWDRKHIFGMMFI